MASSNLDGYHVPELSGADRRFRHAPRRSVLLDMPSRRGAPA